jgi:DNA mismatch endonuclease, patch repair protein
MSSGGVRRSMVANSRGESRLEGRLRRALWAAGARGFHRGRGRGLPGRPDVVFPGARLAVFVHGCFWHRCPACAVPEPKTNADFWRAKFEANARRDASVAALLRGMGWTVRVVWEHELERDMAAAALRIAAEAATARASRLS